MSFAGKHTAFFKLVRAPHQELLRKTDVAGCRVLVLSWCGKISKPLFNNFLALFEYPLPILDVPFANDFS